MLPLGKTETAPNGNAIRCGIEFDAIGRRVAYWFLRKHPGDATDQTIVAGEQFTRVPADAVLHIRKPIEAGQLRGLPWITPTLVRLFQMDQYMDAQVERQKTAALFVGFVTVASPDEALLGETGDGRRHRAGAAAAGAVPEAAAGRGRHLLAAARRRQRLRSVLVPGLPGGRRRRRPAVRGADRRSAADAATARSAPA